MKKTKFTEEQIAFALRQVETGTRVAEVCRKMGIAEGTLYNWKKKYGGLGVSERAVSNNLRKKIASLSNWLPTLVWINKCCRRWCQKSSKASS